MIREDKLKAQTMPSEQDFLRLRRMAGIVADALGRSLDLVTGIAVIEVLAGRQMTLADGVVWNGPFSSPAEEVSTGEAAIIVSALATCPTTVFGGGGKPGCTPKTRSTRPLSILWSPRSRRIPW